MSRFLRPAPVLLLACALIASGEHGTATPRLDLDRGASGLGLALRRVGTTGRVLVVTAHPDDEHNGVLVRLARGLGVRTRLFTLTRGEGGQNAIGPELFQALGVLRTGELESLHAYDGVEQAFGLAYEFGFSFSVEESLEKWGREETLGDIVRAVRAFRPDVILTLPLEGVGGGQHHQATGRLAREAFRAAADPGRYPAQLREGLRAWQARKIYVGGVGGGAADPAGGRSVRVPTGVFDPLLGMTWQQLGSRARAMHRCQMMSQLVADPGPAAGVFTLLDAEPPLRAADADLLDGVDTTLGGLARFAPALAVSLAEAQRLALAARASFDATAPAASVPALAAALAAVRALEGGLAANVEDEEARFELAGRLADEGRDLEDALWRAQGLLVEAGASDGLVVPGQTFELAVSLWNQGRDAVQLEAVEPVLAPGWTAEPRDGVLDALPPGGSRTLRFAVTAAPAARLTQPYWRRMADRDRNELVFDVADPLQPFAPDPVAVGAAVQIGGVRTRRELSASFRYEGPFVGGEKRHAVQVVPELAVRLTPEIAPVPLPSRRRPLELRAFVRHNAPGAGEAQLRLEAPKGWSVRPSSVPLRFAHEGEEIGARFELVPPLALRAGTATVRALATRGGREFREGVQVVEYEHVERRQLVRPAQARLLALDVRTTPGAAVGYVMGSGDGVAEAIAQLGVPLTLLSAEDLAFGDLSRFSTIVTGIRAYETRPELRTWNTRLLRWVEAGGYLVVQYNRAPFNRLAPGTSGPDGPSPFAPYPARVTPERISDEAAPVRLLAPRHPLLSTPNAIVAADWDGWVQERGIQLLEAQDPRYEPLLAASDPFPYNPGEKRGLLVDTALGRGRWTYVGLALFRQVPAGVPGGWRLLANLVSRPRTASSTPTR